MYKAIKEIGGYKIGEEVPIEKALVWINMYAEPHVELIVDQKNEDSKILDEDSGSSILEDYLARGSNVVRKNVSEDKLSEEQLNELLELEKSGKNRYIVITEIEKRLAN